MREQRDRLDELGAVAVAVGFSPGAALAELADHLAWPSPWPFLSDVDRVLYQRLGLGRARRREVYNRATLRIYRAATGRGEEMHRPVEDALQLGGDAVIRSGAVVQLWRPSSPDDRPAMSEMLAGVALAAG